MILEAVKDQDDDGNVEYFVLARFEVNNEDSLKKYLNKVGTVKKIMEIDEL